MMDPVRWLLDNGSVICGRDAAITDYRGRLRLIDQTLLPARRAYVDSDDPEIIVDWIKRLVVRGAPAIGCAAALGLAAAMFRRKAVRRDEFMIAAEETSALLAASRPTAVNLFWALDRCMKKLREADRAEVGELENILICEALDILSEDISMCRRIGHHGGALIQPGQGILTHCNAGALATGDYGTALAPMYYAHEHGVDFTVYADETRPLLQGSRLTAWELRQAGVDVITICDNMSAKVMQEKRVQMVIVGADRIAANGDTANKIGTYAVAVLAAYHRIPFYVAAPYSTIDMTLADGSLIPIEQRHPDEVRYCGGIPVSPPDAQVYNPAFDITPHCLIAGIITERGIISPPFGTAMRAMFAADRG